VVAKISIDVKDRALDTAMVIQYCGSRLHMPIYQICVGNSNAVIVKMLNGHL
jgi:hypothetical protein